MGIIVFYGALYGGLFLLPGAVLWSPLHGLEEVEGAGGI